jgi:hypothetical protein
MKDEHVKTPETKEVSSYPGEKCLGSQKRHRNTPSAREETMGGLEKGFANLWRSKRITKKARAGRGQESKWENTAKYVPCS